LGVVTFLYGFNAGRVLNPSSVLNPLPVFYFGWGSAQAAFKAAPKLVAGPSRGCLLAVLLGGGFLVLGSAEECFFSKKWPWGVRPARGGFNAGRVSEPFQRFV
jgi:hypothetical protein